jgi:site-specific DNA-adenine methylase
MDYNILITFLQEKQYLTDLEKDILDTWNELQKNPFDCSATQRQVLQNDAKYPEIFFAIKSMPTTVPRPIERMTEFDIRYNLENQLAALAAKEGWQKYGQ